jgi:hypothetical protein
MAKEWLKAREKKESFLRKQARKEGRNPHTGTGLFFGP